MANRRVTRRSALRFSSGAALALGGLAAAYRRGGAHPDPAGVASGEFVGVIEPSDDHLDAILVAVVADPPSQGAEERRVRVYYCDGQRRHGWFDGAGGDERFAIAAETGAAVDGTVGEDEVAGTLTLADGTQHAFTAVPATGAAGLYHVFADEEILFGVSTRGVGLNARIAGDTVEMAYLLPDGDLLSASLPVLATGTGTFRLIVGNDKPVHHARGASFTPRSAQTVTSSQPRGETQYIHICEPW